MEYIFYIMHHFIELLTYYTSKNREELQYLNLLEKVNKNGNLVHGRNGYVKNNFCNHLKFDLRNGFPLLTTKKMFIRGIVEELLFFIRGQTDTKILEKKNVNIWKGNTSEEFLLKMNLPYTTGLMGPMYGYQWRSFGATYNKINGENITLGFDQIPDLIYNIKNDPYSRRHLLTDYNPVQASEGVLFPCHSIIIQFFVDGSYLDMFCYNRSSDLFLGLPFNIASSSLFLTIIAKMTNLTPRFFNLSLGDCHIYEQHASAVETQLKRAPTPFPKMVVKDFVCLEQLTFAHFMLEGYNPQEAIKAEMVC